MANQWNDIDIEILKDSVKTKNNREIKRIFNDKYTIEQIYSKEKQLGIKPQPVYPQTIDQTFFEEIDTKEKAYVLGLWASDGWMSKSKVNSRCKVGFSSKDIELLQMVKRHMGDTSENYINLKSNNTYAFELWSEPLYYQLERLGFDNDKSHTARYPKIPSKFNYHFIRGCLDGDGCIYINKDTQRLRLYFNGTIGMLSKISSVLNNNTKLYKDKRTKCCYRLAISGKKAIIALNNIYKDSEDLRLERKYKKYQEALFIYKDKIENIPKKYIYMHCKDFLN